MYRHRIVRVNIFLKKLSFETIEFENLEEYVSGKYLWATDFAYSL